MTTPLLNALNRQEDLEDVTIGEWLRSLRTAKGMTLDEAAVSTQIPLDRLYLLEKGLAKVGVKKRELDKLARLYGIHPVFALSKVVGIYHA